MYSKTIYSYSLAWIPSLFVKSYFYVGDLRMAGEEENVAPDVSLIVNDHFSDVTIDPQSPDLTFFLTRVGDPTSARPSMSIFPWDRQGVTDGSSGPYS